MKNSSKTGSGQVQNLKDASRPGSAPLHVQVDGVGSGHAVSDGSATKDLLYLFSNNSIETTETDKEDLTKGLISLLSPYHKKSAHTLYSNVSRLISLAPSVGHVGFLTLTFPDNVTDHKEAYERFRSFNSNFLSKYPEISHWINTKERQKRGAWHYHLLVVLRDDIRTDFNFEEVALGNYSSASNYLRVLWRDLREACTKYGFGRSELLPVRSNAEAMGRYIGKYISKHMGQREDKDKGVRLTNSSRGWVKNSVNFAWYNDNSKMWRFKVRLFADFMGCTELYQLTEVLGSGWAFKYADMIINIGDVIGSSSPLPAHVAPELKVIDENFHKYEKMPPGEVKKIRKRKKEKRDFLAELHPIFDEYKKEIPLVDALWEEYYLKKKENSVWPWGSPPGVPF